MKTIEATKALLALREKATHSGNLVVRHSPFLTAQDSCVLDDRQMEIAIAPYERGAHLDLFAAAANFTPHLRKLLAVAEATKLVEYIEARREADEEEFCASGATYGIDDLNAAKATQRAALAALDEE